MSELETAEAAELGPLLVRAARIVDQLIRPEQVYVCLWSHAGRQAGHIHFVVQPATTATIEAAGAHGPALQAALFREGLAPSVGEMERFAEQARALLGRT
jgi:hypothetical protein